MPISRSLDDGLFELRFDLERQAFRITYYFAAVRRIVLLTVFRKQRMNERHETNRAREAKARCVREVIRPRRTMNDTSELERDQGPQARQHDQVLARR